jgi:hypothetical protein
MKAGARALRFLWLVVGLIGLVPASAAAFYGNAADGVPGAQLVSADYARLEQGDDSTDFAAISADGRYVVIQTRARNFFADDDPDPVGQYRAGGIFRFDLQTKLLAKVADGNVFDEEDPAHPLLRFGAARPSISADGRFIAFTTPEQLVVDDTNQNFDVYVRDMGIPASEPDAFDLVSARDGGDEPAHYGMTAFPFPGSEPGADVSRGVAISADGRRVVFRTEAPSDLPASATTDVAAGQVFLRDRLTDETTLVTAKRDPGTGLMTVEPAGGAVGAALSADGSTVAWTGGNAPAQTPFLGGENTDSGFNYYLWRRVGDGPLAPTRRITGLADPDDPACPPEATTFFDRTSTGPCYGPLADQEGTLANIGSQLPALSGDGYTVAFLTGSGPRPFGSSNPGLDLFLTDMHPGLTRKAATVELTRDTLDVDPATSPPIGSIAISADGRHLAMATVRTRFILPALQFLGEPRAQPIARELYIVDLQQRTLERATRSHLGGDIDSDVQNGLSVSADGGRIAFVSFAGNLFFGDANQRLDAFVATRQPDPGAVPPPDAPADAGSAGRVEFDRGGPQIGVRAKSKPDGTVLLTVSVPAAGGVKAVARSRVGNPRKLRTLSTGSARARGAARSEVRIVLRSVERYRTELRSRGRISARIGVEYVASRGGRRASASLKAEFREGFERGKG